MIPDVGGELRVSNPNRKPTEDTPLTTPVETVTRFSNQPQLPISTRLVTTKVSQFVARPLA